MAAFANLTPEMRWKYVVRAAREIGLAHEAEDLAQEDALREKETGRIAWSSREASIWAARRIFGETRKGGARNRIAPAEFVSADPNWLESQLSHNPEPLWIEALDLEAQLERLPWLPSHCFQQVEMRGVSIHSVAADLRLSVSRVEQYLTIARKALAECA